MYAIGGLFSRLVNNQNTHCLDSHASTKVRSPLLMIHIPLLVIIPFSLSSSSLQSASGLFRARHTIFETNIIMKVCSSLNLSALHFFK